MMYLFWIIAVVLCLLCLVWLWRALNRSRPEEHSAYDTELIGIYRDRLEQLESQHAAGEVDRPDYEAARQELEDALAAELPQGGGDERPETESARPGRPWAWTLAVAVPAVTVVLYLLLGEPGALSPDTIQGHGSEQLPSMETMVARLEARLENDPDNVQGWTMLGRSYTSLGEMEKARQAYAEAVERAPDKASLLLDYAEAIARTNNQALTGRPQMLIDRALELNPESMRGRILRGVAAFQAGDRHRAVETWVALLNDPQTGERERQLLNQFIAAAGEQDAGAASQQPQTETPATPEGDNRISVRVRLSEELRDRVEPGDALFVYARATSGPPMPLAIERHTAADLPLDVVLDDGDAMMDQMNLSAMENVVVLARISKSGNAQPSSGDLQSTGPTVNPAKSPEVELLIDQVVP